MGSHFFSGSPRIAAGNYEHLTRFKNLYHSCPVCGGQQLNFYNADNSLDKEATRIAKLIYEGKLSTGDIDPKLTALVAEKLKGAIMDGYGKNFDNVDYDTPDYNMLRNLERNVYQFSAAKNYQQLKDMTGALKDENGVVRSFKEFRDASQQISYQYNTNWLETEYNTAVNGSTLASRWSDFERYKDTMPLLEYVTAGDSRVREEHRVLNHVKKNMDDEFWNTYYPPNGYNCRCTVNQLTGGTETPTHKINYPDVQPMFRTNLAKQGLVFPAEHPYYDGVPKSVLTQALALIPEAQYKEVYKSKSGGSVLVHPTHNKKELNVNTAVSKILVAKSNSKIKLLPVSKIPKVKNPDISINGDVHEIKVNYKSTISAIDSELREARKQADNIVLHIKSEIKAKDLMKAMRDRLQRSDNVDKFILIYKGKIYNTSRTAILDGSFKIE